MTEQFQVGDRVSIEGVIKHVRGGGFCDFEFLDGTARHTVIKVDGRSLTLVERRPLQVGDILTADSPRPPDNTVLVVLNIDVKTAHVVHPWHKWPFHPSNYPCRVVDLP